MLCHRHTPDTLGTLPDITANGHPLRAWLNCRTITTRARESVAELTRNCKGFRSHESVHARVTESHAQGTGIGRDTRQSPLRVRSVFLLIYGHRQVNKAIVCLLTSQVVLPAWIIWSTLINVISYTSHLISCFVIGSLVNTRSGLKMSTALRV